MEELDKITRSYSLVSIFQNFGDRILASYVQLFADLNGATASQQGWLLSLKNILSFIGQQSFGKTSDKHGRAIVLIFGFFVSFVTSFFFLDTLSPISIIIVYSLYCIGFSAIQPAFSALIGDTYNNETRAAMLGHIGSMGAFIGGFFFLGAGLLTNYIKKPYDFLFEAAGISYVGAMIIVIFLSLRRRIPAQEKINLDKRGLFEPFQIPFFKKFVFLDVIYGFALSTTWPLFPKVTNELATTSQVAIIWFATFFAFSISAKFTSQIKNFIGSYNKAFFLSRFFMFLVPFTFAIANSWLDILFIRLISGLSFGFYTILQKEFILESAETLDRPSDRGWFLGTYAFMYGIFTFVGSLSFGYFADFLLTSYHINFRYLFFITSGLRMTFVWVYLFLQDPIKI